MAPQRRLTAAKDYRDKEYYECEQCSKVFTDISSYRVHQQLHTDDLPFSCELCPYKCKIRKYLSRHIRNRHRQKTGPECPVCNKVFSFTSKLKSHMRVHTGEKPFKCTVCGKAFRSTYCLSMHNLIHTDEKPFQCSFCDYACRDSSTLRKHQERHMGIYKTYPCQKCKKIFKTKTTLKNHIDEVHFGLDTRTVGCELCTKAFRTQAALKLHVKTVHEKTQQTDCEICGRTVSKNNIRTHLQSHVDIKPYQCRYKGCRQAFKDQSSLKKHTRIHYPELQYECDVCGSRFPRKNRLREHRRRHVSSGGVTCDYCTVSFVNKLCLQLHIKRKHSETCEKFICDECGLVNYSKRAIILHLRYGHGTENDKICKICGTVLKDCYVLKEHYLKTHNVRYVVQKKKDSDIVIKQEPIEVFAEFDFNYDVQKVEIDEYIPDPEYADADSTLAYSRNVLAEDISRTAVATDKVQNPESVFDEIYIEHVVKKQRGSITPTPLQPEDPEEPVYPKPEQEDSSRSNRSTDRSISVDKARRQNAYDGFFVEIMSERKKKDLPKQMVNKRKLAVVKKTVTKMLNECKLKKEIEALEEMRQMYNKRIQEANKSGEKKESTHIKYFKKPADITASAIESIHNNNSQNRTNDQELSTNEDQSPMDIVENNQETNNFIQENENTAQENDNSCQGNDKSVQDSGKSVQENEKPGQTDDKSGQENYKISEENEESSYNNDTLIQESNTSGQETDKSGQEIEKSSQENDESRQENDKSVQENDRPSQETEKSCQKHDTLIQESGTSGHEIGKSGQETGKSGHEIGKSGQETGKSGNETGKYGQETAKSGQENDKSVQENDRKCPETEESCQKDDTLIQESGTSGHETGKSGQETAKSDQENDKSCNEKSVQENYKACEENDIFCQQNDESSQENDKPCQENENDSLPPKSSEIEDDSILDIPLSQRRLTLTKRKRGRNKNNLHNKSRNKSCQENENLAQENDDIDDDSLLEMPLLKRRKMLKRKRDGNINYNENEETNKNGKLTFVGHECYICFKIFETKDDLKLHCKEHFDICNEKMLKKCPFCGYVTNLNIKRHIELVHKVNINYAYNHITEKSNRNGSKYVFELDKGCELEIIPSISNLNKIACMKFDEKNRNNKNVFMGKTKLVKKGGNWIIEKEKVTVNNESLLPKFSDEEYQKLKIEGDSYLDRMKKLSVLAKKRGIKMLYPCSGCEKICQTLSALKLHNRKHETNPKRFRPKVWVNRHIEYTTKKKKNKNKSKEITVKSVKTPIRRIPVKIVDSTDVVIDRRKRKSGYLINRSVENRYAAPNPVKNKHKCDKELIEFYNSNIKGKDIEFWQFLKIFNKMSRENVNDFEDLENRNDLHFGVHIKESAEPYFNGNESVITDNVSVRPKNIPAPTENVSVSTEKIPAATENIQINTESRPLVAESIPLKPKNTGKKKSVTKKFTRAIMISKKEYMRRIEMKNQMRKRLEETKV